MQMELGQDRTRAGPKEICGRIRLMLFTMSMASLNVVEETRVSSNSLMHTLTAVGAWFPFSCNDYTDDNNRTQRSYKRSALLRVIKVYKCLCLLQPSHHIPYLYSLAGAASKTQERVRQIAQANYNSSVNGLSGVSVINCLRMIY